MSLIPLPNVPNVPGVPSLLRSATVPSVDALVNQGVSALVEEIFGKEQWAILDKDGKEVFSSNTLPGTINSLLPSAISNKFQSTPIFLSIEFKNMYQVSNYIQEEGAFASYNKVGTPYDCRVRLAVGDDAATREKFLGKLDDMLKSTDTFSVATPEYAHDDCTLQNYQYRRTAKSGVRLIIADLWFAEVREFDKDKKKKTADPQAEDTSIMGQIQSKAQDMVQGAKDFFKPLGDKLEGLFGSSSYDASANIVQDGSWIT